ncbi:hypothetical protein BCR43DRAFT_226348 [Syncephalastrum racemosum]|uniref:Uncharacterized protein n=1 Tax=Syncephalastrum racemosum TaxID=13706 RepID=A0A1X2HJQ9_SYNRA|nr:hypothetical protein BCR43DRAFT_226348 [Syncephalastrum racemosum]
MDMAVTRADDTRAALIWFLVHSAICYPSVPGDVERRRCGVGCVCPSLVFTSLLWQHVHYNAPMDCQVTLLSEESKMKTAEETKTTRLQALKEARWHFVVYSTCCDTDGCIKG